MPLRDIVVMALVIAGCIAALRRPWIGVMLWTWIGIMNPHRYTFAFAYQAPVSMMAAIATLLGLLMTQERESPFKGPPLALFAAFTVWITISWAMGLNPAGDHEQWEKVMKINFMIFVSMALLHSKQHILALAWVSAGALGLLGMKGGVFTIVNAGAHRVWGPPGSFIEDNNEFALALVIAIPLLRFLQLQIASRWGRHAMTAVMVLCALSALGSHSRGALLAIGAMALLLWWRGRSKVMGGIVIAAVGVSLIAFMPDEWGTRMESIGTYEQDGSAMGRISAWWTAWGIGKNYLFGVGFNAVRPELFAKFSPYYPEVVTQAAHSIYFQVLGHHGFIGLALYLAIWVTTWRTAGWLRKHAAGIPEARWAADLGSMAQAALLGYLAGGAFLSLAYFDLPYNVMMMVVLARVWVQKKAWASEPAYVRRWYTIPGLVTPSKAG